MRRYWSILKWVGGVGILVVLVCGGGAAFLVPMVQKQMKAQAERARGLLVVVEPAATGGLTRTVSAPGTANPKRTASITSRVSARIERILVDVRDRVNEGDVMIELDSKEVEASLAASQARFAADEANLKAAQANLASDNARIAGARAQYQNAISEFERQDSLYKSGDVSKSALDSAQTEVDRTKASYEAAVAGLDSLAAAVDAARARAAASKADVERAQQNVEYCTIRAPFTGEVVRRTAEVGEVALGTVQNRGQELLIIEDPSEMLVKARLAEMDSPRVAVGQVVKVYVNGYPDRTFGGTLQKLGLSTERHTDGTMFVQAEVALNAEGVRIPTGTTVNIDVEIETLADALLVPSQAVLDKRVDSLPQKLRETSELIDKDKTFARVVFVLKDGKAVMTPVTTIASSLTKTAIKAGVVAGDPVIIGPFASLAGISDGQTVRTEDKKPEGATDEAVAEGEDGQQRSSGTSGPGRGGPGGGARRESRRG